MVHDRCHDAVMSEIQYVNAIKRAEANLEEANRQLAQAKEDFSKGHILPSRLHQLEELHAIAAQDLQRVLKEA